MFSFLSKNKKFNGKIDKISYECASDGYCYIVIRNKKIIFGWGYSAEIWGDSACLWDYNEKTAKGKKVSVFAHKISAALFTLEGSKEFYIKILKA